MAGFHAEIDAVMSGTDPIPRESAIRWIAAADDIFTLSKLYRLMDQGYHRIKPELGADTTCALIQRYLLECIRQNLTGRDDIEDRWEAARTLHAWFCHLAEQSAAAPLLERAAQAITVTYLEGNEEIRTAIEQGFLEHALETAALWTYFKHWSSDDRLRPAWDRAMEWAKAHPDYTWGLLKKLRSRDDC